VQSICALCKNARARERRKSPEVKETERERRRRYRQSPEGRAVEAVYKKQYRQTAAHKVYMKSYKQTAEQRQYMKDYKIAYRERPEYKSMRKAEYERLKSSPSFEARKLKIRAQNLKNNFGITLEIYEQMDQAQKGVCAICGKYPPKKKCLCVDHNHKTGKVRGLLCNLCNAALGGFKDNIELLTAAIAYLHAHD
jgi:hypothetical protein